MQVQLLPFDLLIYWYLSLQFKFQDLLVTFSSHLQDKHNEPLFWPCLRQLQKGKLCFIAMSLTWSKVFEVNKLYSQLFLSWIVLLQAFHWWLLEANLIFHFQYLLLSSSIFLSWSQYWCLSRHGWREVFLLHLFSWSHFLMTHYFFQNYH